MNYGDFVTEDRRLVILRVLASAQGYSANVSILQTALRQFGHAASRDAIRTDLAWLAEQALLATEDVSGVTVATINQRGADVAAGAATVPGVKKPGPGA